MTKRELTKRLEGVPDSEQVVIVLPVADVRPAGWTPDTKRTRLAGFTLAEIEKWAIIDTLEMTKNREEAAKMLGIGERTLYRKIKEYEI